MSSSESKPLVRINNAQFTATMSNLMAVYINPEERRTAFLGVLVFLLQSSICCDGYDGSYVELRKTVENFARMFDAWNTMLTDKLLAHIEKSRVEFSEKKDK